MGTTCHDIAGDYLTNAFQTDKMHALIYGAPVINPRSFFEDHLPCSLAGSNDDLLPEDTVIAFYIEGADGGAWQVVRDVDGARVLPMAEGPKDCEMWCSAEIFMRIVDGSLGSNRAFLSGKLRIAGDIGLAMRLEDVLRQAA